MIKHDILGLQNREETKQNFEGRNEKRLKKEGENRMKSINI